MRNSFIWTAALLAGMVIAYPHSGEGSWTAGPSALAAMTANSAAQSNKRIDGRLHRLQQAKDR